VNLLFPALENDPMEKKITKVLDGALDVLAMTSMGLMTFGVIVLVITRYFFSLTAAWSEELIGLLFVASSFFGCVIAERRCDHIGIDLFYERFGKSGKRRFRIVSATITIFVQFYVFDASLGWISVAGNVPSPGLEIPFLFIYAFLPASCLLIAFYAAVRLFEDLKTSFGGKGAEL